MGDIFAKGDDKDNKVLIAKEGQTTIRELVIHGWGVVQIEVYKHER